MALIFSLVFGSLFTANAQTKTSLRRPTSPQQPMWLIHIDTWNWPDPQKIIDMVPEDIRPYVVFNISLSINHDSNTGAWKTVEYGYETAKSWLRVCAENRVWAMIQPSSGGFCHFSDFDLSVYEEFFRDYPNFLGFNYCEQFWGFDDQYSVTWLQRVAHWANLMKLNKKYGGYLVVSWCGNQWDANINPLAMMKRNPDFAAICKESPEYLILCEKYTQQSYQSDMESVSLGAYLSGFAGNYGIRYDETGWSNAAGVNANFTMATGGAPYLEHIMLTGETVIDGPETIPIQSSREISPTSTADGYTSRRWEFYPQFYNVTMDIFRKMLDGTVRIPSRAEVIDRTKVVIINDVNSGNNQDLYSSPQTLFEGLYRMDGDGNYEQNKSFFKKTGRYPTIPTVYQLADSKANSFAVQVNKSAYATRWPNIAAKVSEFDGLFPAEYSGDIYAGRNENAWVIYNPYKTGQLATGSIPFKYNSCDRVDLSLSQYTSGVIKEYANKLTVYLSNYDNTNTALKTDLIKIHGSTTEPTYSFTDRANHQASSVTKSWSGGVYTLTVNHNGPLDITLNCSGSASGRLTSYKTATIATPDKPATYTGPHQYEAEVFDYKNISRNYTNGVNSGYSNYTGQGFMDFGTNASASIKKTINVLKTGAYRLETKYFVAWGDVNTVDLYVNGAKVATPVFVATNGVWTVNKQKVNLKSGSNTIEFRANNTAANNILFDHIIIVQGNHSGMYDFSGDVPSTNASSPAAELITLQSGTAGVISYTDAKSKTSNSFKTYSTGSTNGTGIADLDMFPAQTANYSVVWKEYYGTAGAKKGVLLRGTGANGSCPYAVGMKQGYLFIAQNNDDNTITLRPFVANSNGIIEKPTYTSGFKVLANQPCWYRATAIGDKLIFECSSDSLKWAGGSDATYTDNTYSLGSTELVWGLNSNTFDWTMDDIAYLSGNISTSQFSLSGFGYVEGSAISGNQSFTLSGSSLTDNISLTASDNYEVSLNSGSGYASTLALPQNEGTVSSTIVYVRLRSGLTPKTCNGELLIKSTSTANSTVSLSGAVTPQSVSKKYDFSNDVATTSAGIPPALNASIGLGNDATAGVVSYTDASNTTSNAFRPYSGGNRNATGVVDLGLFSGKSTDYSVTWKQYIGSVGKDYKVGVMLRGDASKIGESTTGYVQGMMQGYLFIAYTKASGGSEFRIYKSTSATTLSQLVNTGVSALTPTISQPVWYKATVSGSILVSLKLEYSTDNVTWQTGAVYSDSFFPFMSGATQIVWGLGVDNKDFYLDNITFNGIESGLDTPTSIIKPIISNLTVVSKEYYTITGVKIHNVGNNLKGLYIVVSHMSDGSVTSSKVFFL